MKKYRTYIGYGHRPKLHDVGCAVYSVEDDMSTRLLPHKVRHSTYGFAWGEGNYEGAQDLALSLLWDVMGSEPVPWIVPMFHKTFVGTLTMSEECCFVISTERILAWIGNAVEWRRSEGDSAGGENATPLA